MRIVLLIFAFVSAFAYFSFFVGALPSEDGWHDVMVRFSLGFAVLSASATFLAFPTSSNRRFVLMCGIAAVSGFLVMHPHMQEHRAPMQTFLGVFAIAVVIGFVLAFLAEELDSWFSRSFALNACAAGIGLIASAFGPLCAYAQFGGQLNGFAFGIELFLFAIAFLLTIERDRRKRPSGGMVTAARPINKYKRSF